MKLKSLVPMLLAIACGFSANLLSLKQNLLSLKQFDEVLVQLSNGERSFCAKADLFSLKFTIRSFSGSACKEPLVAALAKMICVVKNIDDYNNSGCHKNASLVLGKKRPLLTLISEFKKYPARYERLVCSNKNNADPANSACNLLNKANIYLRYSE